MLVRTGLVRERGMVGLGKENEMRGGDFPGASGGACVQNIFVGLLYEFDISVNPISQSSRMII